MKQKNSAPATATPASKPAPSASSSASPPPFPLGKFTLLFLSLAMFMQNTMTVFGIYVVFFYDFGTFTAPPAPELPLPPLQLTTDTYSISTLFLPAEDGTQLECFFYLPHSHTTAPPPLVIMAHGMNAQKDMRLPLWAAHFASHNLSVLLFDYRTFGGSYGLPRQIVDPWMHVSDYKAIVRSVTSGALPHIDRTRLALWGTSFSGGHVLVVASQLSDNPAIRCVSSQVPFLDPFAAMGKGNTWDMIRLGTLGFRDFVFQFVWRDRVYVRGFPEYDGELAVLSTVGKNLDGLKECNKEMSRGGWQNKMTAVAALAPLYRPYAYFEGVKVPVLLGLAAKDDITPRAPIEDAHKKLARAELFEVDTTHFGFYLPGAYEEVMQRQLEFFQEHLL